MLAPIAVMAPGFSTLTKAVAGAPTAHRAAQGRDGGGEARRIDRDGAPAVGYRKPGAIAYTLGKPSRA
jgi:hypothetical protein